MMRKLNALKFFFQWMRSKIKKRQNDDEREMSQEPGERERHFEIYLKRFHVRKVIYLSCTCVRIRCGYLYKTEIYNLLTVSWRQFIRHPKKKNGESANHSDIRFSNIFLKNFFFLFLSYLSMKIEIHTTADFWVLYSTSLSTSNKLALE